MPRRVPKSKGKLAITTEDNLHKSINKTDTTEEIYTFFQKKKKKNSVQKTNKQKNLSAFKYRRVLWFLSSAIKPVWHFFWPWNMHAIAWGHLTALSIRGLCQRAQLPTQHRQDEQAPGMSPIFISQSALRCQACSSLVSSQSLEAWWQVIMRVK